MDNIEQELFSIVSLIDTNKLVIHDLSKYVKIFDEYISNNPNPNVWVKLKYAKMLRDLDYIDTLKIENLLLSTLQSNMTRDEILYCYYGLLELYAQRYQIDKYYQTYNKYTELNYDDRLVRVIDDNFHKNLLTDIQREYIPIKLLESFNQYYSNLKGNKSRIQYQIHEIILANLVNKIDHNKILKHVSDARRYKFINIEKTQDKYNIIYCCNNDYASAMMVSILSFIVNNLHIISAFHFYIFVDSDVDTKHKISINKLFHHYGIKTFTIIPVNVDLYLKSDYGNTGTIINKLDKSAYYRIFALNHIHKHINQNQTLYLDCDTLVMSSLLVLFEKHKEKTLYACEELSHDDLLLQSKQTNMLDFYFNSGVLLVNLNNSAFQSCIDRTLRALIDYDRLFFHDQCALNIGFDKYWDKLPIKYNYLLHRAELDGDSSPIILHFSSRIKPWHYANNNQELATKIWYGYYNILKGML
jgi:lipopolysaccharide biosynthesis glycosyltransferase